MLLRISFQRSETYPSLKRRINSPRRLDLLPAAMLRIPSSHSSGGNRNDRIGKTGNRYLRGILIRVAHAAAKVLGSVLGTFYRRAMRCRGASIAIVALIRKILMIIPYLLTNMEPYEEPVFKKMLKYPKVQEHTGFSVIGTAENVDRIMIGEEGGGCSWLWDFYVPRRCQDTTGFLVTHTKIAKSQFPDSFLLRYKKTNIDRTQKI